MKIIDVNLSICVSDKICDVLEYNDDKSIDVEFRVISELSDDDNYISEKIKNSKWLVDSTIFYKMIQCF